MSGHKTRSVFERYNVVDEEDLRAAASIFRNPDLGRVHRLLWKYIKPVRHKRYVNS
jgi:hypothetical protein